MTQSDVDCWHELCYSPWHSDEDVNANQYPKGTVPVLVAWRMRQPEDSINDRPRGTGEWRYAIADYAFGEWYEDGSAKKLKPDFWRYLVPPH